MDNNNDFLYLIARLMHSKSVQHIRNDIKKLGNFYVNLIGRLDLSKTKKDIEAQSKGMKISITPDVNSKGVQSATKQAMNNAQKVANTNKVKVGFELDRDKLVNQIKILGKENSKLFGNSDMAAKYNNLLDSAKLAQSKGELKSLRKQLSAFRAELKASNNDGLSWGNKLKESIKRYTTLFGGASFVYTISNQIRNAWQEAKTLDDALVDLQKVTDEINSRDALYKYFDRAVDKAKELNVKVSSLIYSITEFKKMGWSLGDSEIGAEWATKLENVGDVDIDTAIASIKTSIASFDTIGGYGNDQLDKKLEAYVDLINNMSNKYSIDAQGLSEAIRLSAGTLTEAHTSIEEAVTMFATANKYYNNPDYLGNTVKIGSLRLRASSGDTSAMEELEEMGENVEELTSATSTLREKLLGLTGVDIMVDENTFKSYYDQLLEISQVIDKLDDTSRANVLETLFGKNRSAAGAAILSGMQESASAYEDAITSVGSATKEYEVWMQSADAASQRFANNMTEVYQGIINGNTVRDLTNMGSSVLEFANAWGILEGSLRGVLLLGVGKFITTASMAFVQGTKSVERYGQALRMVNNIPNGNQRYDYLKKLASVTRTLTNEQLKQVLSNKNLSQQEKIRVLQLSGLGKKAATAKLAEMGLTKATQAQTVANNANLLSVEGLKNAMIGLGVTIKTWFMSNPIGIVLMGISLGASAISSAISNSNQKIEEQKAKTAELTETWNSEKDSINQTISKYQELNKKLADSALTTEEIAATKEELSSIQDTLVSQYGSEANGIDLVNGKYEEQISKLRELNAEKAKEYIAQNAATVQDDRNYLTDTIAVSMNLEGKEFDELEKYLLENGLEKVFAPKEGFIISDTGTREELYNQLVNLYSDVANDFGSDSSNPAVKEFQTALSELINNAFDTEQMEQAKANVRAYAEAEVLNSNVGRELYDRATTAVNEYNKALASGEAKNNLEAVRVEIDAAELDIYGADQVFQNIWDGISSGASDTANAVKQVNEAFSSFDGSEIGERLQYIKAQFDVGEISYREYFESLQSEIDNIDFSNYTDSLEEAQAAVQQFFVDSMQENAEGLSELVDEFDSGKISITEYLEGYVSIGQTLSKLTDDLQENSASWNANGEAIDSATSQALDNTQTQLSSAINTIQSYQDSIYSLEQIMTQSVEVGSDEFAAHAQVIAQDLAMIVQQGGLMADEVSRVLGTTTSEIAQSLTKNVSNQGLAAQAISANTNSAITNMATAVGTLFDTLGNAISNFKVDVTFGVKSITTQDADLGILGNVKLPAVKFGLKASGESLSQIGSAISSFGKSVASNFTPQMIDINDFVFGNTDNTKDYNYTPSLNTLKNYNDALGNAKKGGSGSSKETAETFDWIKNKVEAVQRVIANLGKTVSATYKSWTKRNSALSEQISKIKEEISVQKQAYAEYMSMANGVGLSTHYQDLVKNGALDISTITDETLVEKIKSFEEFYNKAIGCQDTISDLNDELAELARTKFDNLDKQFKNIEEEIQHEIDMVEGYIDQTEAKGHIESKSAYESLIKSTQKNVDLLTQKYSALVQQRDEAMSIGKADMYSDYWYELTADINSVESALQDANTVLIEYNNSLRELEWDRFDYIQKRISSISKETEFILGLLSEVEHFDDKGNLTDEGQAVMGLHTQGYNVAMNQADQYATEIEKLNKELEVDPNNQTLLERREQLLGLQRESIELAKEEQDAIMDLVQQGIDKQIEAMETLAKKYKDTLHEADDLYDFQKKVENYNKEIASLEKQLSAWQGDDSEEAKSKIQQIRVGLEEAKENREEAEREQYIRETEKLLDSLVDEYTETLNGRMDDINGLMSETIRSVNENALIINETLQSTAESVGYTLSEEMQNIWSGSDGIKAVVSMYGDDFNTNVTTVNNTLLGIKSLLESMIDESDKDASDNIVETTKPSTSTPSTPTPTPTPSTPSATTNPSGTSSSSTSTIKVGGKINAGSAKIYDYAGDTSGERQLFRDDPIYTVLSEKNGYLKVRHHKLSSGVTGWFKKSDVKAYKTGGLVDYTGLAWVDGQKKKPEAFLNAQDTENISELKDVLKEVDPLLTVEQIREFTSTMDGFKPIVESMVIRPNFVPNTSMNQNVTIHNEFTLHEVQNGEQVIDYLQRSKRFENIMYDIAFNKNSLAKYRW